MPASVLDLEFDHKLLFVTGKGGTGKTLLTSVLGIRYAAEGKKVLLIDAENSGTLAYQFEHGPVGYSAVEVTPDISILQVNTDDALAEYLQLYAKIPTWAKITPLARLIDLISHAAPGVREILVAGKIGFEAKKIIDGESDFDIVIVDAPSSGHVISLIDAPRALSDMAARGLIRGQTQWLQDILHNAAVTGVVVVTTNEEVVISETRDLLQDIETLTEVAIAGVVINKDVADLGHHHVDSGIHSSIPAHGSLLYVNARSYYLELIDKTRLLAHTFGNTPVFTFPLVSDITPTVRSLTKSARNFLRVAHDGESDQ